MKNQGIQSSLLAVILASTAQNYAHAAPQNVARTKEAGKIIDLKKKVALYKLAAPARYNDSRYGTIEGKIYLEITDSNAVPSTTNQIKAEYEGLFYFESNNPVNGSAFSVGVGPGDDGIVILDLAAIPEAGSYLPYVYNIHSCNSTTTECSPLALQVNIFKDGTATLNGDLGKHVEILSEKNWDSVIVDESLSLVKKTDQKD